VSTEEQAENPEGSIRNQEQRLREFIRLKNSVEAFGEIVAVYTDPGVSAKNMNRPGFQRMLNAIGKGEVDLVLVTELSRFSRSTKDFTMLQEYLEEHDCKFMSLRENFDTSGAAGSMVLNMMASIAEFERRQTAERVSHSFLARAKRGLYNGGAVILGYKIYENRPGYLLVDPDMAEVVKFAFESFLKYETLAATTKFLNSQKLRLPRKVDGSGGVRDSKFTIDCLYRLLQNKAYIGVKVYSTKNGLEEAPAVWEPIVDKEIFNKANRLLKKNRHHKRTHADRRFPYTLSGLVFCDHCDGRMSGKSAHGSHAKVGYYEHIKHNRLQASVYERLPHHNPHRVPAAKIEPIVWQG
jgi:site-specific DNA recombinase